MRSLSSIATWMILVSFTALGFVYLTPSKSWQHQFQSFLMKNKNRLMVGFMNVGQGSCQWIHCLDHLIWVDCGTLAHIQDRQKIVQNLRTMSQMLKYLNHTHLHVVASHKDSDHTNLLKHVNKSFKDREHIFYYGDIWEKNRSNAKFLESIQCGSTKIKVFKIKNPYNQTKSNEQSLVIKLNQNGKAVYLMADATGPVQEHIVDLKPPNEQTVLVTMSHHGSHTQNSNNESWTKAMKARYVVHSSNPRVWGHPSCKVLQSYQIFAGKWAEHKVSCKHQDAKITLKPLNKSIFGTFDQGHMIFAFTSPDQMDQIFQKHRLLNRNKFR